jgi:UDP-N-acetyl-D-mannosaminuronate dehydrogenase
MNLPTLADIRIGVVGLGYMDLPLAVHLARHLSVLGCDIDPSPAASHAGLKR